MPCFNIHTLKKHTVMITPVLPVVSEHTTGYTNSNSFQCYYADGNISSMPPNMKHPTSVNGELDTARFAIDFKKTGSGSQMAWHNEHQEYIRQNFSRTENSVCSTILAN